MARKRGKYTFQFEQEDVRLVTQEGMTFAQVGQDLGVNKSTTRNWWLGSQDGRLPGTTQGAKGESVEDELARLRRENRILRDEREILKGPRPSSRRRVGDDLPVHPRGGGQPCGETAVSGVGGVSFGQLRVACRRAPHPEALRPAAPGPHPGHPDRRFEPAFSWSAAVGVSSGGLRYGFVLMNTTDTAQ